LPDLVRRGIDVWDGALFPPEGTAQRPRPQVRELPVVLLLQGSQWQ